MDKTRKLYHLLELSAEKYPEHTALIFGQQELSYGHLLEKTKTLQSILTSFKIGEGDRIAIYTNKSIDFVIAQFGILQTGAAYLPIDSSGPILRNKYIIENCEAKAIIIHKNFSDAFIESYSILADLENELQLLLSKKDTQVSHKDLAYILYTSGSTGKPKGVMFSNSSTLEFINWCSSCFSTTKNDRFSSHAPFHFDLSIFDLFFCIKNGATLVLIDEETAKNPLLLAELIFEKKISIWYSTPTILNLLATYGKMQRFQYDSLRLVLFAGEVFPISQFLNLRVFWNRVTYYNLYGPTETNVCTYFKIDEQFDFSLQKSFPIGKSCEHFKTLIVKSRELYISGTGIMLGYWQLEEQTISAFYKDSNGVFWYKTGDIVDIDINDNLIYKGRIDSMVKRNGYRIELPEIEAALNQHPDIIENAVIATIDKNNLTVITAFVVCKSVEAESIIEMKKYCMKYLPVNMIPNNFIFVKSLPQTASNKIDYQQLKLII